MPTTWYTSDLHLGHPFVAGLRGFEDVEAHDRLILNNLTSALTANLQHGDTLWLMGDISSGWGPQERRALELLDTTLAPLRDQGLSAHLIAGNHDSCHPLFTDSAAAQSRFLKVFDSVQPFQYKQWNDQDVWLCHFPRPGFDHEAMHSRHDPLRLDVPHLLHGHLHSATPVTAPGQVDIGVDAWDLAPVEESQVMELVFG